MNYLKLSSLAKGITALAAVGLLTGTVALAGPVTPTFDTFGSLPAATFGGSGIPNDYVAITTVGGVTLGLTAHQRYANPPLGNDGAGTFFAAPGEDDLPSYAQWNFGMHAVNTSATSYQLQLLWDLNPGTGTDETALGTFGPNPFTAGSSFEESWNLGMGFLGGGFNPYTAGEYSFALILRDANGAELGRSAINVNVGNVPDAASTALLTLSGLGGLLVLARMRQRRR